MASRPSFGERHFGSVELGDKRRNERLPQLVDEMVRHPGGTLPQKLPRTADLDAFYHMCRVDEVTHAAVLAPHRAQTLQSLQKTRKNLLVVHDTTDFDFSTRTSLKRLGQIGNGNGRGYLAHHSLVVDPRAGTLVGLAHQILHTRAAVPPRESVAAKRQRESRESRLWLQGTEGLPARRQVVDVCDRGADTFEFLEHEVHSGRTFVIRACYDRKIQPGHEDPAAKQTSLFVYARAQPALGTSEVCVPLPARQREKTAAGLPASRIARLQLSMAPIRLFPPHVRRGEHGQEPLLMWVVRLWEPDPPEGCEPLEWLLLTNHSRENDLPRAAREVQTWYEWRWVVEEYHKGQKTGCAVEQLQLRDEDRLQPALAVLSIVALTLLQLRDAVRDPQLGSRRADDVVDPEAIRLLSQWHCGRPCPDWTLSEYTLALAQLGGYRSRKNAPPGWQVLWRGQTKLELMRDGARTAQELSRAGPKKCAQR